MCLSLCKIKRKKKKKDNLMLNTKLKLLGNNMGENLDDRGHNDHFLDF